jgi:hypothetical protein
LQSPGETIQDIDAAAEERYWEAYELAVQGHHFAAIYLFGYVAEMLLKSAGFRFDGARPGDFVGPRLAPAKAYGLARFPLIGPESYHSLLFWVAFLQEKRTDAGRALSGSLFAELSLRIHRIYDRWWVSMRYRAANLPPLSTSPVSLNNEVLQMIEDITWLRTNHPSLWS